MRKFFINTIILIAPIMIVLFAAIFLSAKQSTQNMLYTQIDKNELLKNTSKSRIIFVGGSNLAFGLDSKRIKDSLHLNPINTGIHINIGLKYMLANTIQYVKAGDIIVLAAEYQQFYGDLADGEGELFSLVTDVIPQSRNLLDYKQYFKLLKLVPEFAQSKLQPLLLFYKYPKANNFVGRYDRKAFNNYGDACAHWQLSAENTKPYPAITESFNNDILKVLIDFKNMVDRKKARLYITFPGYQNSSYQNSITAIKQVESQLKKHNFNLISTPQEYLIPNNLIFDTPYHLTKEGVDYRTGRLIKDLKKVLHY